MFTKKKSFKVGDRVIFLDSCTDFGIGTIVAIIPNNKVKVYAVEFDIENNALWNCGGIVNSERGWMCVEDLLELAELSEQTQYQKDLEYILSHATNEELDKFCGLTEKDYDNFRKHHLEQTIADVSNKTLKKFMKEIE